MISHRCEPSASLPTTCPSAAPASSGGPGTEGFRRVVRPQRQGLPARSQSGGHCLDGERWLGSAHRVHVYTASKHAVVGLVRQLAHELAPKVRVNGVAPGFMRTDIHGPKALGLGDVTPSSLPDLEQIAVATTPLRFLPRPEDYTGHFVQLASRSNASTTTGTVVACDGGLDVRGIGLPQPG